MAQQRQFVAAPGYLSDRNDNMWSEAFHADVRDAEHRLAGLPWQQVDALPQYPNSPWYCLRRGLAVLIFEKRNRRVIARTVHVNMQHPNHSGCLCVKAACMSARHVPFPTLRSGLPLLSSSWLRFQLLLACPVPPSFHETYNLTPLPSHQCFKGHTEEACLREIAVRV